MSRDEDSAGVYFLSVEDFERRRPADPKGCEEQEPAAEPKDRDSEAK